MPRAIATVAGNPANVLGFRDRGQIKTGQRADLVRVRAIDELPIVRNVWVKGERSF
jgi:alpha-D-ribose 1-methylphosphonate 5-triphosphate diphosphatase